MFCLKEGWLFAPLRCILTPRQEIHRHKAKKLARARKESLEKKDTKPLELSKEEIREAVRAILLEEGLMGSFDGSSAGGKGVSTKLMGDHKGPSIPIASTSCTTAPPAPSAPSTTSDSVNTTTTSSTTTPPRPLEPYTGLSVFDGTSVAVRVVEYERKFRSDIHTALQVGFTNYEVLDSKKNGARIVVNRNPCSRAELVRECVREARETLKARLQNRADNRAGCGGSSTLESNKKSHTLEKTKSWARASEASASNGGKNRNDGRRSDRASPQDEREDVYSKESESLLKNKSGKVLSTHINSQKKLNCSNDKISCQQSSQKNYYPENDSQTQTIIKLSGDEVALSRALFREELSRLKERYSRNCLGHKEPERCWMLGVPPSPAGAMRVRRVYEIGFIASSSRDDLEAWQSCMLRRTLLYEENGNKAAGPGPSVAPQGPGITAMIAPQGVKPDPDTSVETAVLPTLPTSTTSKGEKVTAGPLSTTCTTTQHHVHIDGLSCSSTSKSNGARAFEYLRKMLAVRIKYSGIFNNCVQVNKDMADFLFRKGLFVRNREGYARFSRVNFRNAAWDKRTRTDIVGSKHMLLDRKGNLIRD
ncbi:unnamed protein product [Amoebophrya sp. A25]|nr:unnamed protein product [Amoebophrya sp. A25]|eukprot:GSA25T00014864001.1